MAGSRCKGTSSQAPPKYVRFSRRLRGLALDFILFLVLMVCALQIAVAFNQNDLARVLGFGFVIGFLLYEPLLVSLFGGTIGHYLSNIKVVDDRTNGNVSFLKAVGRVVIKTILGWYSFISMVATRRHQALYDLLTRSTVQIAIPPSQGAAILRPSAWSSRAPACRRFLDASR